ncbi:MAG: hypothetical protein Q8O30_09640 [Candidatus Omnitrophota bacterium]|nr:hypothetical protein [Candidatus Omnitrophota bacterium]
MLKKVYLKSWGCQMNVRDSEVIAGLLTNNGYRLTKTKPISLFSTPALRTRNRTVPNF